MARGSEKPVDRRRLDHPPRVEDDDSVRERGQHRDVVADEEDPGSVLVA